VDSKDGEDEVKSLDKGIETIIAHELAMGSRNKGMDDPPRISSRSKKVCRSDACNDADAREEMIELENDAIDTLVDKNQDLSTKGIDTDGWIRD
jgi:N utilization substance protein A